jgi:hypothetical protein
MHSYSLHNAGGRNCFRCGLPLTDAASLNEGVGPICRKLDNAVLARLIPSDMGKVLEAYQTVDTTELTPETLETFMGLEAAFRAEDAGGRADWRKEVKRIEWMLSHKQSRNNIKALKAVVLALGYVGIVALWDGEAATGLATVFCIEGRLTICGPKNLGAIAALKCIPNWQFHKLAQGENFRPSWSFPASAVREFRMVVLTHYPNFEGLAEALEAAEAYNAEVKASTPAPAPFALPKPSVTAVAPIISNGQVSIIEVDGKLKVKTPFRVSYVAELRDMPKSTLPRKWVKEEQVWVFEAANKDQVLALIKKHYGC